LTLSLDAVALIVYDVFELSSRAVSLLRERTPSDSLYRGLN
jgi:hypothetical protein